MSIQPGANVYTQGFGSRPEDVEVPHIDVRAPTTADTIYPIGKRWINKGAAEYSLASLSTTSGVTTANWIELGASGGALNTLSGTTGTATPSAGNIQITGTGGLTFAASGSTITGSIAAGSTFLETLTGDTGGAISPSSGNINLSGGTLGTFVGSGHTLTLTPGTGAYPITPFVVGPLGKAGYQTVQSALTAANTAGGGIVYVQPGTYSENLTLYGNVAIVAVPGNSDAATSGNTVTITGVHTPPTTGSFAISNINLASATHIFSSTAAGSASLTLENCFVVITNGFTFNLPNWTGTLVTYGLGDGSTNNGMVNNTGGATCFFVSSTHGAGTGQTMITSGSVQLESIVLNCPWNAETGTVINSAYNIYTKTVTCSNNSTGVFKYDAFASGSSAALTQSSTGTIELSNCYINSSNSPAITGSGTGVLTLTNSPFINNKLVATTLTVASDVIHGGNFLSQYVVAKDGSAPYSVIQNAINDAVAYYTATSIPQTVYVKPGVYTENLTLQVGIDLCAAGGQVDSKFTQIIGTHTLPSAAGSTAIYGIWFTGTTACFTASSGTTKVNMFNVITEITGTGYTFNINGWSGELNIFDYLQFDTGTNGFVNNPTGGAEVNIIFAGVGLTQNLSATAQISGNSFFQGMLVSINMNFVGTSNTQINMGCELQGTISTANSASVDIANTYCFVGTAQAINHLSSGTVTLSNVGINSTNATPIAGTGTVKIADVCFVNNSTIASGLTKTWGSIATGAISINGNLAFGVAGNKITTLAASNTTAAGANAFGTVTLSSGTATVATTAVTSSSIIMLTRMSVGASTALGILTIGTVTAGTSFVISAATQATPGTPLAADASVIGWMIIN